MAADVHTNGSPKLAASSASAASPPTVPAEREPEQAIIFFDGVCGFCNRVVDFALERDRQSRLRFAPLQGETARRLLSPADVENLSTFIFYDEGRAYRRSTAVARMLWQLGGAWRAVGTLLWVIPRPLRDMGYRIVAKYRYALFGKKETCRMPNPSERERFLL